MKTDKVTRFEVIGPSGRIYTQHNCSINLSLQDNGRTLKVFIDGDIVTDLQRQADKIHGDMKKATVNLKASFKKMTESLNRL